MILQLFLTIYKTQKHTVYTELYKAVRELIHKRAVGIKDPIIIHSVKLSPQTILQRNMQLVKFVCKYGNEIRNRTLSRTYIN